MRTFLFTTLLLGTLVVGATPARAATGEHWTLRLPELMTAEEFEETGLAGLSPAQLATLERWMSTQLRMRPAPAEPEAKRVESEIDGDFDGWEGQTVFRLANGQVWQQAAPSAKYYFAHRPHVVISTAPARMRVEGLDAELPVRRLR